MSDEVANKNGGDGDALCAKYLLELRTRYGEGNPMLIPPDKRHAAFAKLDQQWCDFVQERGWCKVEYVTKWMEDENGVPRQFDLTALHLLDPALKFLKGCKVTVEQHTDTKVTLEPEPEDTVKKRRVDFRGRAGPIAYARMKDLVIAINGALCEMGESNPGWAKGAVMYLRLVLNVRGEDLENEKPELYQQIVERLGAIRPVRT